VEGLRRYQSVGRRTRTADSGSPGCRHPTTTSVALDKIDPGQMTDPDFLDAIRIRAIPITIHEGETRNVDLRIAQVP